MDYFYSYGYLITLIPYGIIWLFCYLKRKDLQTEILWVSVLMALGSFITAYLWWTIDWWHPPTITGTRVGIEDLLLGFFSGGIMASVFQVFFREHIRKIKHTHALLSVAFIAAILLAIGALVQSGLTSFWASTYVLMIASLLVFWDRKDLARVGLVTGVLMVICSLPGYFLAIKLDPLVVQKVYDFQHLSGILVIGIPIEEYIFWFLAGMLFGPFYEWQRGFRNIKFSK